MTNDAHTGQVEGDVPIGNQVDKERMGNPVAQWMVARFDEAFDALVNAIQPGPGSVHEVGCGEGRVSRRLSRRLGVEVRASDFSGRLTTENRARGDVGVRYVERSIYDLDPTEDRADLVVCCEVLEHLERPAEALAALRRLRARCYIFSVPREPLWRVLNVARGKYIAALGNTPGHLHHWSARRLVRFLTGGGFQVEHHRQPLPWTMVSGRFL